MYGWNFLSLEAVAKSGSEIAHFWQSDS